ncbi:MAG TPA: methyl-accepting chemotaxis protein [Clostridia bacterium]
MKWFYDLKISAKILSGFILVALIAAVVGITGIICIKNLESRDKELYNGNTISIKVMGELSGNYQKARAFLRDLMLDSTKQDKDSHVKQINSAFTAIADNMKQIYPVLDTEDEKAKYEALKKSIDDYIAIKDQISELALADKNTQALQLARGEGAVKIAKAVEDSLEQLSSHELSLAENTSKNNSDAASKNSLMMIAIFIAGMVLAIFLGVFISGTISRPVKKLVEAADKISLGDVNINIDSPTKDEIGVLMSSFGKMAENIKEQANVVKKIADGELSVEVREKSDSDVLSKSLKLVVESLRSLVSEAGLLTKAALDGRLSTRGNTEKFKGGYRDIVDGVNKTLDAVIEPLNVAADYVDRISKGNIPQKINDTYNGDFNTIKNNLNTCIDNINALIEDANMLEKAAVEGRLSTRADASRHGGDYRKVINGVNKTLDAVIGPLNVAADYVDRISKGNIPQKINDTYNGDFNTIKNNLNTCIDNINALVADANMLSAAAAEGRLDIRADALKHEGDYRKIIEGVNRTLDSVIKPLKVAADYVDKISKGNIPSRITDSYNGDFNEIKNNLNTCIDAVNNLVTDTDFLVKAALDGKLSTRADASRHGGDFAKIVDGINRTLDAVIEPVKEASAVLQEMAKGNLKASVKGNYKGDHAEIKDALNFTISTISGYISDITRVLTEMSSGNLTIAVTTEYVGDFVEIKNSLNMIIESLNEVLGEINAASEQVAEGSRQVSASGQALSQGSTEQASSIEELTASLAQIAVQTKQNAMNANQANELAVSAKENAKEGNMQMQGMLKAMAEINESSGNISKIIKVIDEIAFQTNILALNAAVEAARAGQHGKGFAVVAEEVRNLAARSANAAKETTMLIEGSISKVEGGTRIASDTAEALNSIVEGVTRATDLVGEIASASNDQASGIAQINQGIEQVSQVTQTNSATAEESAAASEELSSQAQILKELVARFRLKNRTSNSRRDEINGDISRMIEKSTLHRMDRNINLDAASFGFGKY